MKREARGSLSNSLRHSFWANLPFLSLRLLNHAPGKSNEILLSRSITNFQWRRTGIQIALESVKGLKSGSYISGWLTPIEWRGRGREKAQPIFQSWELPIFASLSLKYSRHKSNAKCIGNFFFTTHHSNSLRLTYNLIQSILLPEGLLFPAFNPFCIANTGNNIHSSFFLFFFFLSNAYIHDLDLFCGPALALVWREKPGAPQYFFRLG